MVERETAKSQTIAAALVSAGITAAVVSGVFVVSGRDGVREVVPEAPTPVAVTESTVRTPLLARVTNAIGSGRLCVTCIQGGSSNYPGDVYCHGPGKSWVATSAEGDALAAQGLLGKEMCADTVGGRVETR